MGDGQKVSLRLQASTFFRTYSLSFSEPWFGSRKPVQLNTSFSYTTQYNNNFQTQQVDRTRSFNIMTISAGIYKRLTVPDDYFGLSQTISYQHYDLNNYNTGLFTFGDGTSRNLAYTIGLSRSNKGINPIFPIYGAEFSITGKFTLPYSLFNGIDYATLGEKEEYKLRNPADVRDANGNIILAKDAYLDASGRQVADYKEAAADPAKVDQQKYNWLEYYKLKFKGDWYTKVAGTQKSPLVVRSMMEFGFLGAYNQERGIIPFERFFLGGDGMQNFAMDGREVIGLRGYPNGSLTPQAANGQSNGASIYNKFSLELRYPITLKASASIFALTFLEAGSSFDSFKNYNPFALNRSAGVGLRVFMPAFGLLGIDFGYGFDGLPQANGATATTPNGWETHFIIGQQF
jgi:outer membrane protein insertion porin family